MSEPNDPPQEIISLASHAVAEKWGMGALHVGAHVVERLHDAGLIVYRDEALAERDELAARLEDTELSLLRVRGEREALFRSRRDLLAEVQDWRAVRRLAYRSSYDRPVQILIDGRTELTIIRVGGDQYMLPDDAERLHRECEQYPSARKPVSFATEEDDKPERR